MVKLGKPLIIIIGVIVVLGIFVLLGKILISSPAALSVTSDPSDQKVYLDGQEVGTTPFSTKDLKEGEVTLAFGEFSQKVRITAGATTAVNWTLGPSDSFSAGEIVWLSPFSAGTKLLVISKPAAEVFSEGESLGSAPLSKEVSPGEYNIEIKKEGYFSRTLKVAIKEGYQLNISASLSLDPFAAEETEIDAGGEKIKVIDLSTTEPLLLADYALWAKGAGFWAARDEEKVYDYFLTAEGKLYDPSGSEVSLASLSEQTEVITLGYLGESGQGLSSTASATLEELQTILFPTPKPTAKVLILETGTGWLRVRSGPGISHSEIGKATVGKKYEYLGKENNWFKIKFEGKEGWVSGQFAERV